MPAGHVPVALNVQFGEVCSRHATPLIVSGLLPDTTFLIGVEFKPKLATPDCALTMSVFSMSR